MTPPSEEDMPEGEANMMAEWDAMALDDGGAGEGGEEADDMAS